jgi:predicted HTH domain antitoxin
MQITLDIPDAIAQGNNPSQADWLREIAIALFQQELITLGTASHIAGMPQLEFQGLLCARGISLHYDLDDYKADIESLRRNNWR